MQPVEHLAEIQLTDRDSTEEKVNEIWKSLADILKEEETQQHIGNEPIMGQAHHVTTGKDSSARQTTEHQRNHGKRA